MSHSAVLAASPVPATRNPAEEVCAGPPIRPPRSNRSAGKGRRRRAVAEQRRAEQEHWSHLVHDSEEEICVVPSRPPTINRRQLRRAARHSSHEEWEDSILNEDDNDLDVALALSLSLSETSHNASGDGGLTVNLAHMANHGHLEMSYESLVMLENVKCTAPAALVSSLTGHIFNKDSHISLGESVDELCTICQNEYKDRDLCMLLPCLHTFHDVCGSEWFLSHSKLCPVCKHDVTDEKA